MVKGAIRMNLSCLRSAGLAALLLCASVATAAAQAAASINYGGRDELRRAFAKLLAQGKSAATLTEQDIPAAFDLPSLPDVDLLIRTGGEKRLSNFLLWHAAYAELVFTDTLWPDYGAEEFRAHIDEFNHRTRRFGAVPV